MKKILVLMITAAFAITSSLVSSAEEKRAAKAFILIEASTGKTLMQSRADIKLPIASVTKTMLLLIAAEKIAAGDISADDDVTITDEAAAKDGSVIWLTKGEVMKLSDLLKAVVIASANDAACAVACHIAGSEAGFVAMMNAKAAELGLKSTHFTGCVGYDDGEHFSTASDVAQVMRQLSRYRVFDDFWTTRLSSVRAGTEKEAQLLNTNKLAHKYEGLICGKTGTTDKAGYCLAVSAQRGGMELISVVLGADSEDTRTGLTKFLLDNGFDNYELVTPRIDYGKLSPVKVKNGTSEQIDVWISDLPKILAPKSAAGTIEYHYAVPEQLTAPVERGQKIGKLQAILLDEEVLSADITAFESVPRLTFQLVFTKIVEKIFE